MRQIVVHRPGGHDRLRLEEHPDPAPGPGEVLVEVEAAGVNYADCVARMGLYASAKRYVGWPLTPGFDVAGRVAACGPGVDDLSPGDPVLAVTRFGGYASAVVVPRAQVFPRPADLDATTAAALPTVFLTAWYALIRLAHIEARERVLVHSAAGGVGGCLVQLARLHGCDVVGVVGGAHKVAVAAEHGASAVIDTSREALWSAAERHAPEGYDVVLDANGYSTLRGSYAHLASPGRLVVYGFHGMLPRRGGRPRWPALAWGWLRTPRFDPLSMTTTNRSVLAFNLSFLFPRADLLRQGMDAVLGWLAQGRLRAPAVTTYPLERAADAHRDLESGRTTGKLVLLVEGDR